MWVAASLPEHRCRRKGSCFSRAATQAPLFFLLLLTFSKFCRRVQQDLTTLSCIWGNLCACHVPQEQIVCRQMGLQIRLARHAWQGVTLLLVNPLVHSVRQDPTTQMKGNRRARHVPLEHTARLSGQQQLQPALYPHRLGTARAWPTVALSLQLRHCLHTVLFLSLVASQIQLYTPVLWTCTTRA